MDKILLAMSVLSILTIFTNGYSFKPTNMKSMSKYVIEESTLDIDYLHVKAELIQEVEDYLKKVAPSTKLSASKLVDECEKHEVSIAFALAQGHKESHFGTKGLAAKTNSVFNVGAYDGHSYNKIRSNFKYKNPNQSIDPYLKLIKNRYLVDKSEEDLLKRFVDSNNKRYASNKKYENDLRKIHYSIKQNTNIIRLEEELRAQKVYQ